MEQRNGKNFQKFEKLNYRRKPNEFTTNWLPSSIIAQVTDEEEIKELINNGKAVFYISFDPTADSLPCGTFYGTISDETSQMAGNDQLGTDGPWYSHDQ